MTTILLKHLQMAELTITFLVNIDRHVLAVWDSNVLSLYMFLPTQIWARGSNCYPFDLLPAL
jgi:hypothetical protein